MRKSRLPLALVLAAILQIVPPLVLPFRSLKAITPAIWAAVIAVFVLLGITLLRRRSWSRVASIFIQGFSVLVRILFTIGHVTVGGKSGSPVDVTTLAASVGSMLLSIGILYALDRPDVQLAMAQQAS